MLIPEGMAYLHQHQNQKNVMKLRFCSVLVLLLTAVVGNAQTADEVIHKYLDAIGGVANWKKVTSSKAVGKMTVMGTSLDISVYEKPVNKQKVIMNFQGSDIVTAYDGKEAWGINPMTGSKDPQKLPPEMAKEMSGNEFEDEFIDYKKKGYTAKYLGNEEIDAIKCHKIELNKKGAVSTYYFDTDTGIQIMEKSLGTSGPAAGQELNKYYSDYQEVNGLMIPFTQEVKIGGQSVQKLTFTAVTLNEPMEDSMFAFPKK